MLYMVEMDFRNPAREADWHVWYIGHVAKLVRTVPGFRASQRFRAMTPTPSPWLAMHDVVSGAVFESKEYKANGGPASTGEWQSAHTNWYRNLFAGIDNTPEVAPDAHLLVLEADAKLPRRRAQRHMARECRPRPHRRPPRPRHRAARPPHRRPLRPAGRAHLQADLAAHRQVSVIPAPLASEGLRAEEGRDPVHLSILSVEATERRMDPGLPPRARYRALAAPG